MVEVFHEAGPPITLIDQFNHLVGTLAELVSLGLFFTDEVVEVLDVGDSAGEFLKLSVFEG